MKKALWISLTAILALALLLIPIPRGPYEDGGTREFVSLTYRLVKWNRITDNGPYQVTKVYWFPNNFKSLDTLFESEDISEDTRQLYTEQWLDKNTAERYEEDIIGDIIITEIYQNCFIASKVIPSPMQIKLNGQLPVNWCVGDQVICTYENIYYDAESNRIEADFHSVEESALQLDPNMCYKPVIYLYPETETDVHVTLSLAGKITCSYPSYRNGWSVTAMPDGTLRDSHGMQYNYLYWEGETDADWDLSTGFCVPGKESAQFLEDALSRLGLTRKEANEFIVYWLPLLERNPYNIINFQTQAYTDAAKLDITPAPDTLIRVFMTWQAAEYSIAIPPQELTAPKRSGFTVVEWGGTEINK